MGNEFTAWGFVAFAVFGWLLWMVATYRNIRALDAVKAENQRLSDRLKDEQMRVDQLVDQRGNYRHALECIMWMETPKANATVRRMSEAARAALYD